MPKQDLQAFDQPLEKHRLERRDYSIDFTANLDAGEVLGAVESIKVFTPSTPPVEVTSQFNPQGATISGEKVNFRLSEAASSTDQDATPPYYLLRAEVSTTNSQQLVSIHALYVSEQADPSSTY